MRKVPGVTGKGSRWYVYADYKGKRYSGGGYDTVTEANKASIQLRHELQSGKHISEITLKEFTEKYFNQYAKEHLKAGTFKRKKRAMEIHVLPVLGNMPLKALSVDDILKLKASLNKSTTPINTYKVLRMFRSILNKAVQWDYIYKNVAKQVDLPKVNIQERKVLTSEQIQTLIDNAPSREKVIIALGFYAGMRIGEVFGLKWVDIDLENRLIKPTRQYNGHESMNLKTESSKRPIRISDQLYKILTKWQSFSEWLFPGTGTGRPLHPITWHSKTFKPLVRRMGLPDITFHCLRHSIITILLSEGIPINQVSQFARHKNSMVTLSVYAHVLPNSLQKVSDAISSLNIENGVEQKENSDIIKPI